MKTSFAKYIIIAILAVSLSACVQAGNGRYGSGGEYGSYGYNNGGSGISKTDAGTVVGGIGGALLGAQVGKGSGRLVSTAAGALLGAYLGNSVGASLDRADMAYYDRTSQNALETNKVGQTATWTNPDSGNSGTVTPTRTFQSASNQYCREYTQTVNVGGKTERAYGTACRQQDGSWKIVQ